MIDLQDFQPRLGERRLLSPLSISIGPGTFAVLTGASGAGKSRLIETLSGDPLPYDGDFSLKEPAVSVPQSLDLCKALTAAENVATARVGEASLRRSLLGFSEGELAEARRVLRHLGLDETEKATSLLSGGELQRVALGRLLRSKRRIWFLDEPVSQLDDPSAVECMLKVKNEARDRGAAVLCVLHQEKVARAVADRLLHWEGGRWSIV